jgi:cobalamin biosynthetic protein CobC
MDIRETRPELTVALEYHGGNIDAARRLYPKAPEPWIDLSTGINPQSYPVGAISPSAWARLPESSELAALEHAARRAYDADPATGIVATPGTQAVIQWLPRLCPARRVGILGPTYGEYEKSWRGAGTEILQTTDLKELEDCDVGIIVNPNNPDGRIVPPELLAKTAAALSARGGLLVVDEAFMDVIRSGMSLAPALPEIEALVLRSFGKAYGLAGIRLGFALSSRRIADRLRAALGPWAVSGPAIEIGIRALTDRTWLAAATARLSEDAMRLDELLLRAGFKVIGGTPLFRLTSRPDADRCFQQLCRAGILTRPFSDQPDRLRFGIPGSARDWDRLESTLLCA